MWRLLFGELQTASSPSIGTASDPAWARNFADEEGDDIWEEERSWRDPSAHKFRVAVAKWLRHSTAERAITLVRQVACSSS